jgi:hypothetical protein
MLYEVVKGQILLAKRQDFIQLHQSILIPTYLGENIQVILCLITEVGNIGEFIDIYAYDNYDDYDKKTTALEEKLWAAGYYPEIQKCIANSINVQLMSNFGAIGKYAI